MPVIEFLSHAASPMATYTVVSTFADHDKARAAVDRLVHEGVSPARIHLHSHADTVVNADALRIDDMVTGGIVHNLLSLLDGLFGATHPANVAATYAEAVRKGSALMMVDTDDEHAAAEVQMLCRAAGAADQATVPKA